MSIVLSILFVVTATVLAVRFVRNVLRHRRRSRSSIDRWFDPAIVLLLLGTALYGERASPLGDTLQKLGLAWGACWFVGMLWSGWRSRSAASDRPRS